MVIDTSNWKEFKISKLFDVKNSKSISDKRDLEFDDNNPYDFIGRTPINNGIQGKIVKQDFEPNNENTFSVTQIGEKICLFRDNKWYSCQNIFILTPLYPNLIDIRFYICCVITKTLKIVFGEDAYTSYPTKDTLSDMLIKLPATPDGEPDWDYMESYMKKIMQESEQSIENLNRVEDKKDSIDISSWMPFKVSDIFVTEKHGTNLQVPTGAMMSKKNLEDGNIPRVTVSNYNNGITGYYSDSNNKNYRTYENFISVSFLGTVFYQPKKTSLDMKVHCLKPLNYELNVYSAMFIVSIIRNAILKFAYSDQLSSATLTELEFSLPTTFNGEPDWQYMENYMKKIIEESEQIISELQVVTSDNHVIEEKSETIKKDCLDKDKAILEEFLQFCNRK